MSSHIIPHRGLDYCITATLSPDRRRVLDVELDCARWRSTEETITVFEDFFDIGLKDAFWPYACPAKEEKVPEGLATFMFHYHDDEIRAALGREVVDEAIAAEAAAQ